MGWVESLEVKKGYGEDGEGVQESGSGRGEGRGWKKGLTRRRVEWSDRY